MLGFDAISESPISTLPGAISPNPVVSAIDIDAVGHGAAKRIRRKFVPFGQLHADYLKPKLSPEVQAELAALEQQIEAAETRITDARKIKARDQRSKELLEARQERDALLERLKALENPDTEDEDVEMLLLYG